MPYSLDALAAIVSGAGLVVGLIVLSATRAWRMALFSMLDFWLAAGLMRLSGAPSWPVIGSAAALIAIRRLSAATLRERE